MSTESSVREIIKILLASLNSLPVILLFNTDLSCQSQAHQAHQAHEVHQALGFQSPLTLHCQHPPERFLVELEAAPPLVRDKIRC